MRNRYESVCFKCNRKVRASEGQLEKVLLDGAIEPVWKVYHAQCLNSDNRKSDSEIKRIRFEKEEHLKSVIGNPDYPASIEAETYLIWQIRSRALVIRYDLYKEQWTITQTLLSIDCVELELNDAFIELERRMISMTESAIRSLKKTFPHVKNVGM